MKYILIISLFAIFSLFISCKSNTQNKIIIDNDSTKVQKELLNLEIKTHKIYFYFDGQFYKENVIIKLTNSASEDKIVFKDNLTDPDYHAIMVAEVDILDYEVNIIKVILPQKRLSSMISFQSIKSDFYVMVSINKKELEFIVRDSEPVFD